MRVRTPEEVKNKFRRKGASISGWAIRHGYPPNIVYDLLAGRRPNPTRGKTHEAAVRLGLIEGQIDTDHTDHELAEAM